MCYIGITPVSKELYEPALDVYSPNGQERLHTQLAEPLEGRRLHFAAHNHHHFVGQLHVRLEAHVTARRWFKHEPEIYVQRGTKKVAHWFSTHMQTLLYSTPTDVYNVSVLVDHDVAVVPILDLQQIADHRVGGHWLDEIAACRLKLLGRLVAVVMQEVVHQIRVGLAAQLIAWRCVRHALNDAALMETTTTDQRVGIDSGVIIVWHSNIPQY